MIAIGSYVLLAILAGVALVLVKLGSRLVTRAMKELVSRGKLTVDIASFLGSLLRGIIWVAGAVFIVTDLAITFGLSGALADSIWSFLSVNAGRFGVMIVILAMGYVSVRIFTIAFSEYKRRSKLHPLTLELFQNIVRYLVYAIVAVLLLTNLLVIAGLQTLAGSLVTLFAVFIGLVVSFAATGSIGNALSGIVIMSWRPYREGDRVEIGVGTYGDVAEVDIMFTKIKTIKNELVHVPNSQVLNNKIVNYSTLGKVIVHYQVTIAYEVPRRLVERLLLAASKLTEGLVPEPEPFVLVRELSNNYVLYEINAYTDQPNRLITIYSDLMKNTLDTFANAGVEILSPQHIAVRESTLIVKRNQENAGKIRPRKRLLT